MCVTYMTEEVSMTHVEINTFLQTPLITAIEALTDQIHSFTFARYSVYIHTYIHTHIHIYTYIYTYIHILHTYITCIHTCMHACIHTYMHTYIHTDTHIHHTCITYIHYIHYIHIIVCYILNYLTDIIF